MDAALGIMVLGMAVLGYFMMRRLDAFLSGLRRQADAVLEKSEDNPLKTHVLLFGQPQAAQALKEALALKGIDAAVCAAAERAPLYRCNAAFALAEKDLDNLLFCSSLRRTQGAAQIFALCNDRAYAPLYRDMSLVFYRKPSLEEILMALGELSIYGYTA